MQISENAAKPAFQTFIGSIIAVNYALIGFKTDFEWWCWWWIELLLLIMFSLELVLRQGCSFFYWPNKDVCWNFLDFFIIVTSIAESWLMPMGSAIVATLAGFFTGGWPNSTGSSTAPPTGTIS